MIQVLQEVLRFIPPVGAGFRQIIQDYNYQGWFIPKDWFLFYQIRQTHQDIEVFPEPEKFKPERFSSEFRKPPNKPFEYLAFGGGMRECLGKEFAQLEMKYFAASLIRSYSWELIPGQDLSMNFIPVPRPKDGLKVSFKKLKNI